MNLTASISQVNSIASRFEVIFGQLESVFPQLIYRSGKTSFQELKEAVESVTKFSNLSSSAAMTDFSAKYTPIFDKLNEKINDLKSLDKMIADLKEDSEQMELIALNAMVISVKSGEKGQAFSKITENLQRLSKDMFLYSDKLSAEETHLLNEINELKTIFSGIIDSQRSISAKDSECSSESQRMVSNVGPSISEIESKVSSIYPAIENTKSILSNKERISDSFNSVKKFLGELSQSHSNDSYEKSLNSLQEISNTMTQSCSSFAGNWSEVIEIMESADNMRMDFESRFLNNHAFGNNNIAKQVSSIIDNYRLMIGDFNNYQLVQKDLQGTCQNITTRAKTIYSVFENLRPVMSRLHHVRILQQIEVSKNDAIKSVQDSVTDMDNLINAANKSLDEIQTILESFIQDTGSMLANFVVSITKDNENMISIRNEKEVTLGDYENTQSIIARAFSNFGVFPDDFQKKCVLVQQSLQDLMRLNSDLAFFTNEIESEKNELLGKE